MKINLKDGPLFGQLGLARLLGSAGLVVNETSLSQNIYQATIILKIPKLKADPITEWLRWTGELALDVRTQRLFTVDRNSQGQLARH